MNQTTITDYFQSPNSSKSKITAEKATYRQLRLKKRHIDADEDPSQTMIDAGQKDFGLKHCKECGMVYSVDTAKDVNEHKDFHNRSTETKFFRVTTNQLKTWKNQLYSEEVASKFNGVLFRFTNQTKSTMKTKMEAIIKEILNVEIGCDDIPLWDSEGKRSALVFVIEAPLNMSKENLFVASIVIVEPVEKVYLMPLNKEFRGKFIGINRIWVHKILRRQGLARMMLDLVRRLYSETIEMVPKTRIAFSEPTEDGEKLAIKYLDEKEGYRFISYCL